MWVKKNGELIQITDKNRIKFRTNISEKVLTELRSIAKENGTHVNYLLETGLNKTVQLKDIQFNKKDRPNDRVQYKTTYDRKLLESVRGFASKHNLFINDVIEYSVQFISIENSKMKDYKNRIENNNNL